MSYKKFTRSHGKTARVRKYAWSNPDHNYRGETRSTPTGGGEFRGINITIRRPPTYGLRWANENHAQLRRIRHLLNMEIKLEFR